MGRVYDALKRAAEPIDGEPKPRKPSNSRNRNGGVAALLPAAREIEEQSMASSTILAPANAGYSSASTAHTTKAPDGSALPGGIASRDAGATLDAVGSARAADSCLTRFPRRASNHIWSQSRNRVRLQCEQFRALRTRLLQAGERSANAHAGHYQRGHG